MNEQDYNLIQCGDDGWAPWSVVCVHLATEQSTEWVPIPSKSPEVDHDWVCSECEEKGVENLNVECLRAVCIHCVRRLREANDPSFNEDEEQNENI